MQTFHFKFGYFHKSIQLFQHWGVLVVLLNYEQGWHELVVHICCHFFHSLFILCVLAFLILARTWKEVFMNRLLYPDIFCIIQGSILLLLENFLKDCFPGDKILAATFLLVWEWSCSFWTALRKQSKKRYLSDGGSDHKVRLQFCGRQRACANIKFECQTAAGLGPPPVLWVSDRESLKKNHFTISFDANKRIIRHITEDEVI